MKSKASSASTAIRLLAPAIFGTLFGAVGPVASADDYAYYVSNDRANAAGGGTYGTIDLNTGLTSTIVTFTPPCCGGGIGYNGLGVVNGQLYTTSYFTTPPGDSALLHVTPPNNPAGTSYFVGGNSGYNIQEFGSTNTGLYAVDYNGNLISVNPVTGAGTLIGATGITNNGSGLSANGSTLFLTGGNTLYTVNTMTGAVTTVGNTGPYQFLAMVYEDGTLYGAAKDTANGLNYVAEINPTSGAVSDVIPIGGAFPVSTDRIWGLADVSSVSAPEIDAASAATGLTLLLAALLVLRGRRAVSRVSFGPSRDGVN
jgi:hypothetical protein